LTVIETIEQIKVDTVARIPYDPDPYADKTPTNVLEREFLLTKLSLSTGQDTSIWPFELLLKQKTIQDYLKLFGLLKSDMKVRIVIMSTSMQYGFLLVSKLPYMQDDTSFKTNAQLSQADCEILSVNLQQGCEMHLPYLSPYQMFPLAQTRAPTPTYLPKQWRINIKNFITTALSSTTSDAISVDVFASFSRPVASGYIENEANFQSSDMASNVAAKLFDHARGQATNWLYKKGSSLIDQGFEYADTYFGGDSATVEPDIAKPVKLDLAQDISTPKSGGSIPFCVALGDATTKMYHQTKRDQDTSLKSIALQPTLVNLFSFAAAGDTTSIPAYILAYPETYAAYLARSFKYFRGGTQILLKFFGSPLTATRIQIMLSPLGSDTSSDLNVGDLPSWVVTLKGDNDFMLDVPYLQTTMWSETFNQFFEPKLIVRVLDDLPQPYDVTALYHCAVFVAASGDFELAGLQSCVPTATLQSLSAQFANPARNAMASYQGGIHDVYDVLSRFSSRDPEPTNIFPFPLLIADQADMVTKDNFDYFANLFGFYSGNTRVKVLFTKAPTSGLLALEVVNSRQHASGKAFKAGNSMLISSQAVWPILELEYPYQSMVEMDSVRTPVGMYNMQYDFTTSVSALYLAATKDFRLFYLFPTTQVAEFQHGIPQLDIEQMVYVDEETSVMEEEFAVFQSRVNRGWKTSGTFTMTPTDAYKNTLAFTHTFFVPTAFELEVDVFRIAGTTGDTFTMSVQPSAVNALDTGGFSDYAAISGMIRWEDVYGTSSNVVTKKWSCIWDPQSVPANSTHYVSCMAYQALSGASYDINWTLYARPLTNATILYSPVDLSSYGKVAINDVDISTQTTQLGVHIASLYGTLPVQDDSILDVSIRGVEIFNQLTPLEIITPEYGWVATKIEDVNILSQTTPLATTCPSGITISGTVLVEGPEDPTYPVYTTSFH
jgi:hypothetical protein